MVFSASFPKAMQATPDGQPGNSLYYIRLQAAYALIGLVAMMLVSCVHPDTIARMSPRLLLATLALTAITLSNLNIVRASHGAARWLDFGPVSLQPSEFAKLALILFIAAKLAEGQLNAANFGRTTVRIGLATGLLVALLLLQKDQGMAILIGLIALMMAYLGHLRGRWLIVLSLLGIGVVVLGIYSEHYRMQRIMAYFDPLKYKTEWGWQILLMKTAIARGGLTGLGLGMCPEKFDYLPEAHTDAIFCVVASEAGLIGAVITLAAMGCIISRIVAIAVRASNNTGYFLAAGIAVMLAIQTLLNVAVATHLIPVTGLTLPFVSYGGSSLVTTLVAIGVVLSVQRHRDSVMQP
jgi:cell division protein FtsW